MQLQQQLKNYVISQLAQNLRFFFNYSDLRHANLL